MSFSTRISDKASGAQYISAADIHDAGNDVRDADTTIFQLTTPYVTFSSVTSNITSNVTNGTSAPPQINPLYFYKTEQLIFLSFLLFCIVLGNAIVLLAVGLSRRRHSRMHFFIMHLALADLSVGLITVLTDLVWKVTVKWYAGDVMCRFIKFAQAFVMFASTYMLVALSIDRYDAIARPLSFSTSWTRCKILVTVAWGLSALFASPLLFLSEVPDGTQECWLSFPEPLHWIIYFLCITLTVLVIPAIIIAACYAMIICIIYRNSHLLQPAKPKHLYTSDTRHLMSSSTNISNGYAMNSKSTVSGRGSPKPHVLRGGNIGRSSKGIIPQAKIRTVKMTFSIVLVFILCWSPYFVFNWLHLLRMVPETQSMVALATFVQSLAPLNAAANPIIYGVFSTRICRYLRQLKLFRYISPLCCCDDGPTPRSSGMSEFSNVTDTAEYSRRSPRMMDTVDYSRRAPRMMTPSVTANNIEMCDLVLSSVRKEDKFT